MSERNETQGAGIVRGESFPGFALWEPVSAPLFPIEWMQNSGMKSNTDANRGSQTSLWKRPPVQSFVFALLALWVASIANISSSLNHALADQHARWNVALRPQPFPFSLLVIGIDDASVRQFGRMKNWSRSRYADLLKKTRTAKVVGLDILFTEPDLRDTSGDDLLAQSVRQSGNVVLPAFVYNEARPVSNETQAQTATFLARLPIASRATIDMFPSVNAQTIEPPLPALTKNAVALSQASVNADADNVYRRPVVAYVVRDAAGKLRYIPHITAAIASIATGESVPELLSHLPLEEGTILLRSVARRGGSLREGIGTPVPYLSFADAVKKDPDWFRGKVVLIGETVTGTADIRPNAIDNGLRGVELNAEIVANLMGVFSPLRDFPLSGSIVLIGVSIIAPIFLFATMPVIRLAAIGSGIVFLSILLILESVYFWGSWVPPWAEIVIAFTVATLSAGISRAGQEAEQRRQLQDMFSAYVAPEQVEELARNPEAFLAGMKRVQCAVLFSDIRSFTTYSEQNPPEIVDRQMREYLTEMSSAVFVRYNFLDKFVGDAVMALFGGNLLPRKQLSDNYAAESVLCAIDMLDRLDRLNATWSVEGLPSFKIGIGIHYGDALFGNVGSANSEVGTRRLQLTALGDSVNLASRLQTATKEYQQTILVSGEVKERAENSELLQGRVFWQDLGTMTVRGREKETPIWGVVRTTSTTT